MIAASTYPSAEEEERYAPIEYVDMQDDKVREFLSYQLARFQTSQDKHNSLAMTEVRSIFRDLGELKVRASRLEDKVGTLEGRVVGLGTKVDKLEAKVDSKFEVVAGKFDEFRSEINGKFEQMDRKFDRVLELLEAKK